MTRLFNYVGDTLIKYVCDNGLIMYGNNDLSM